MNRYPNASRRRAHKLRGPHHERIRSLLRGVGIVLIAAGAVMALIGLLDLTASLGEPFRQPTKFVYLIIGLPVVGVGLAIAGVGYLGRILRYQAGEIAPVAKDTIEYVADGTRGVMRRAARDMARGIAEGLRDGATQKASEPLACRRCGFANDADARFCKGCGVGLALGRVCSSCEADNDADARYCERCGATLSDGPRG